ncbi:hypothetical protein GH714_014282 [Hevea brasiliensis]|uniref:Uncharacterized protein n=1 Tax=Hevea brasiliensis TaxID=3981 RepID=A0A6A6K624_HEVBR|nr:hypothetical protein GH714_014282 [Hevea brasiliensis]
MLIVRFIDWIWRANVKTLLIASQLCRTNRFDALLKAALLVVLPVLFGSCTVVTDFADICYHSYPLYLKELRDSPASNEQLPLREVTLLLLFVRLIHVPGVIIAGLVGLIVDIPLFTAIAIIKSPYMLFKGWFRLIHDLISREGPFLETACIPIAGLTILLWPLIVVGSILVTIFSSIFIGLYASVVAYQERSFRRGIAYVISVVAEFDECTNDGLYLREGSFLPKPRYRKKKASNSSELSVGGNNGKSGSTTAEGSARFVPSLAPSRSVRETIQEVKMVQTKQQLFDWFFHPLLVLKEQIRVIKLGEGEERFLQKVVLFGKDTERIEAWDNGSLVPQEALRAAQLQGISRRMIGMVRSVSKFPTYRRRFRQVVKALITYSTDKEGAVRSNSVKSNSIRSVACIEDVV